MKPIYLITESDGFFGQRHMPWEGLDLDKVELHLGEEFKPVRVTWMQLANGEVCPHDSVILHSSSQQPEYKNFIDDILLYLLSTGNVLVPSIHATRSHENKGYQELHKRILGIPSLRSAYFAKVKEVETAKIGFPVVLKKLSGFGSSGVCMVKSPEEFRRAAKLKGGMPWTDLPLYWKRGLGHLFRRHVLRRKNLKPYGDYYAPMARCVLQEFIPQLSCDYKVLTFQKQIFLARREVRANDFRASGSGKIEWEQPPPGLLDFARATLDKFDEPFMSFDIAVDGKDFKLIEFQGTHFGPLIISAAPTYFVHQGSSWNQVANNTTLEAAVGLSLRNYLQRLHKRSQ